MSDERRIGNDIIAVVMLTFIVFLVASLATFDAADPTAAANPALCSIYQPDALIYPQNPTVQNSCGSIGAWMADMLIHVLGVGAWYLVVGLVALEIALFRQQPVSAPWFKTIGWMLSLLGLATMGTLLLPDWIAGPVIGSGGYLGALTGGLLRLNVGMIGGVMIAGSAMLVGLMMWTEYLVFRTGRVMFAPAAVAMAALLPFGILHGLMKRFNRAGRIAVDDVPREDDLDDLKMPNERRRSGTIRIRGRKPREPEGALDAEQESQEDQDQDEELDSNANARAADESESEAEPVEERAEETEADGIAQQPHFTVKKAKQKQATERDQVMNHLDQATIVENIDDYELPSLDLLLEGDDVPFEDQKRDALKKARILESTCLEFGYKVEVVEVETGPVISQYEIQLEAGLRLQKITALADDLAIALRVPSVRIVAPIPGKNTVGVEVPNETRQVVRLRDVMEQCEAKTSRMSIPLFLGNDAVGAPMLIDLAQMPHLLIAGRTGTGKSVCLNAIIASILMTRRPDEVRMLMIDPKMVELSGYARLPHLMHPVVTDMKKAEAILAWAVEKMEDRYRLLARAGVRHINSYNQLGEEELIDRLQPQDEEERREIPSNLPFIVIVADELADLMMTAGKEVEQHIIRLAQKSRAVGIHLILATQKPTVDVITGLIKSNLPARLAFQVASKMDSRVVLDSMGAEKLLGSGDMLFLWPGTSTLLRGQGTYLSDDEIEAITEAVSTGEQNFVHELVNIKVEEGEASDGTDLALKQRDDMYEQAVDVVVAEQRGSVSLLQRSLGIGYGRAARLIDFMEEDGFVGPYNGSKSRDVVLTAERWAALQSGGADNSELEADHEDDEPQSFPLSRIEKHRQSKLAASQAVESDSPRQATGKRKLDEPLADPDDDFDDGEDDQYEVEDTTGLGGDHEVDVEYEDEDGADYDDEEYEDEDDLYD